MSALFGPDDVVWDSPDELVCFFCHDPLDYPAVHWSGASGHLYLHRACFGELFVRLAVDVYVIARSLRTP
jgi:hypothetical protein